MPGVIESYIHTGNRVGVLVEVNCETEWTARTSELRDLAKNIAMQVAACPNVKYIKASDIPADVVEKEKAIEMTRDDLSGKQDFITEKIVQGRIEKHTQEMCLLAQPYIRDQSITVADLIKLCIAQLGENIQVRRFVRFILDESTNPPPPSSGSGIKRKPLPNPPDPLAAEAELE